LEGKALNSHKEQTKKKLVLALAAGEDEDFFILKEIKKE